MISNRNYYSSSDDADGEMSEQNNSEAARVESTESPTRRSSRRNTNERRVLSLLAKAVSAIHAVFSLRDVGKI